MQPTRNLEELYAEKLYEINTKQAKIIAELKSTVSFYADEKNCDSEGAFHGKCLEYNMPCVDYGDKARETLQRIALLESGLSAESIESEKESD
jgi:hypothetical protein